MPYILVGWAKTLKRPATAQAPLLAKGTGGLGTRQVAFQGLQGEARRGKSRLPGNQNAFRHGLARIAQRRADGIGRFLAESHETLVPRLTRYLNGESRWPSTRSPSDAVKNTGPAKWDRPPTC